MRVPGGGCHGPAGARWDDRITRYEQVAEVRSAEFAAHVDDEVLG